jgi:transcriptional regulator with XRE-family HTH domain
LLVWTNFPGFFTSLGKPNPSQAGTNCYKPATSPCFAAFFTDLLELRSQGTPPYDAGMLFGDPHIGMAIAIRRKARGHKQIELARAIGVDKTTMSKYETGDTRVPEDVVEKVARFLGYEVIEILDTAYAVFRFNYCRDEAKREGTDLEEVIARYDSRASIEEVHAAQASYMEKLQDLERKKTEFFGREKSTGFTVLRHVVETDPKKGTRKKKTPKQPARKES